MGFVLHENINRLRSIIAGNDDVFAQTTLKSLESEKSFLSAADHIVCLASYMKELLCNEYQLKQKNMSIIPNGLRDMNKQIDVKKVKQSRFFSNEEKIILFAGRLDEIKGLSFLIKAFREVLQKYPSCRLVIAGSGACDVYLKEAKDICSKITYAGLLEKHELYELYSIAHVGVVPSLYEPFGYVAVEMMMYALPLVVTATSGLNEIVDENCGMKIPLNISENSVEPDVSALSEKILYLLQNPNEAKRLGKMSRKKYLENYSSEIFRSNMLQVYEEVLQINTNENDTENNSSNMVGN
jgi:glycosyltransferase